MKRKLFISSCAVLCSMLLCSCSSNPDVDHINAQRDVKLFDAAKLGIKSGSTVRISMRNNNEFVQQTAVNVERQLAARNITVIKQGMPDYWLLLNGAFEHYSDSKKSAALNRHVYVKDTGTSANIQLRVRSVNSYDLTSHESTCVRTNRECRPRIFYKDAQYSSAGMVCRITLYRTKDLNMLTSLQESKSQIVSEITDPSAFYNRFATDAGDFVVRSVTAR